jgi:hypothetical protein
MRFRLPIIGLCLTVVLVACNNDNDGQPRSGDSSLAPVEMIDTPARILRECLDGHGGTTSEDARDNSNEKGCVEHS